MQVIQVRRVMLIQGGKGNASNPGKKGNAGNPGS